MENEPKQEPRSTTRKGFLMTIDCEKCGAIYHIKIHTTRPHEIKAICPFAKNKKLSRLTNAKAKI